MIILAGTLLFAVVAPVAAHNLDPRIYIATDVERVLGFSPMAQLPDFHQVSSEVNEEYMLRLAAAIEHAYQQGGFKSCIFTGVGPGAGVTTVAARVRNMLEGMGRSTVLVDATGAPPADSSDPSNQESKTGLVPAGHENRPSSLLQQMAEEMDSETIVLTDTAPLLASGETEYLARFVDSAIVVIQSGLTTRAQLREVAQTLQRLEVAAVGFVLNRVSIEKANPSFRQSVRAVEQRLAVQSRSHARYAPRTRPSAHHDHQTAEESFVVTKPEPVKPPAPARFPDASRQPSPAERPIADSPVAAATSRTPVSEVESLFTRPGCAGQGRASSCGRRLPIRPGRPSRSRARGCGAGSSSGRTSSIPTPAAAAPTPAPEAPHAPVPPARPAPYRQPAGPRNAGPPRRLLQRLRRSGMNPCPMISPSSATTPAMPPRPVSAAYAIFWSRLVAEASIRTATLARSRSLILSPVLRGQRCARPMRNHPGPIARFLDSGAPVRLTAQPEFLPPKPMA